jgi:hypothetical protein
VRRRRAGYGLAVDKRNLTNGAETGIKKVALKYCGGCNPSFDRVAYVEKIRSAAGPEIEWVTLDCEGFDAVLLVAGCDTACPGRTLDFSRFKRTVFVKNDKISPKDLVRILLESEEANED